MVPQNELQGKQKELELDANALISRGGKVCFNFFFFLVKLTYSIYCPLFETLLSLSFRFLLLFYHMQKLWNFVVVAFLIIYLRSVFYNKYCSNFDSYSAVLHEECIAHMT